MTRRCPVCGRRFAPPAKHPETRHCSRACSNRANAAALPPRACAFCGKAFRPAAASQRYCSASCRAGARLRRDRSRRQGFSIRPRGSAASAGASLARVRAYLALPPAERYARRGTLTKAEHKLAQKLYLEAHTMRTCSTNDLCH